MTTRLMFGSAEHKNYSALPQVDRLVVDRHAASDQRRTTLDEAAAALRERLPGRSRKAKGRFRRQQREVKLEEWRGRLSVYSEASSLDLTKLAGRLDVVRIKDTFSTSPFPGLMNTKWKAKAHFDALHLSAAREKRPDEEWKAETEISEGEGLGAQQSDGGEDFARHEHDEDLASVLDVFLLSFGAVVFWNFASEANERAFMLELAEFADGPRHDVRAAEEAMEEMEFMYGDQSRVRQDIVELTTTSSGEKLAASMAIAQSCLLSVHEWRLSQTIARNEHIPIELARTGSIQMSGHDVSCEIGRLFLERNAINLEPVLQDIPEFIWSDDTYESTYKLVYHYLEITSRIDLLNKRLTIVGQLLDVLRSQQEHMHANKLELIIIFLVGLEVILQLTSIFGNIIFNKV